MLKNGEGTTIYPDANAVLTADYNTSWFNITKIERLSSYYKVTMNVLHSSTVGTSISRITFTLTNAVSDDSIYFPKTVTTDIKITLTKS